MFVRTSPERNKKQMNFLDFDDFEEEPKKKKKSQLTTTHTGWGVDRHHIDMRLQTLIDYEGIDPNY